MQRPYGQKNNTCLYLLVEIDRLIREVSDLVWPELLFLDLSNLQTKRRITDDNVDYDQVGGAFDFVELDVDFTQIANIERIRPVVSPATSLTNHLLRVLSPNRN